MISKRSLHILQIVFTSLGYKVCIIPIKFTGIKRVDIVTTPTTIRWMKFWRRVLFFAAFVSFLELWRSLQNKNQLFVAIMWQSIFVMCRVSAFGFLRVFQEKADCIIILFNEMLSRVHLSSQISNTKHNFLFVLLIIFGVLPPPLFIIGVPLVSSHFWNISHSLLATSFSTGNRNVYFQIFIFFAEFISMIPLGCIVPITLCAAMVCFNHNLLILKDIFCQVKVTRKFCLDDAYKIGLRYRQVYMFTKICNEAFETFILATLYYVGGAFLIFVNLIIFQFHCELEVIIILGLFVMQCLATCFIVFFLTLGGIFVSYSYELLQLANSHWRKCPWSRSFFRSCPVIALNIGKFIKIDRIRGLIFFRFILHRTAVLVVNMRMLSFTATKV